MKKSIVLAAAVASLMAGAVQAESTVYGIAHASIVSSDVGFGVAAVKNILATDNSSRLGFKGNEDLGNGMKVVYQMEMAYDLVDGGGIGATRNSFVGLAGDFGTVLVGRHDTPDKSAFYAAGNDHLGDSIVDLNGTYKFQEDRVNNAIAYISPALGDLKIAVALVPGEGNGLAGQPGDGLTDGTSVGVMYKAGPIKAGLGILDKADAAGVTEDSLMNIGGSYNMGDLTIGLQYQVDEDQAAAGAVATEETIFAVSAAYKMGANTLIANFGNNELKSTTGGVSTTIDSDAMGLAVKHSMSKKTTAYVAYSSRDGGSATVAGTLAEATLLAVGLQHKF